MHAKYMSAIVVGAVVWWAGRGYRAPMTPVDSGLYSHTSSLPHMEQRLLGQRFQCQQQLSNARKMGPPWQHLTCWCTQSIHECLLLFQEEESAVTSLIIIRMKFAWSQQTWWAGGCLQATRAEANGSVSVCFSAAAAGKRAPSCQVTDLSKQLLGRRGGCAACAPIAAQYTQVAMAVLCKYTLHNGAATCDHTDSCFVLHRRFAPTLGTVEQNKHQNIISIYVSIYISA